MNLQDAHYAAYALVKEMMETADVIKRFNPAVTRDVAKKIGTVGKLFLTGEGSSRIFPAKNAIRRALTTGMELGVFTDGSRQAATYDLKDFAVFCASNSGRTKEIVLLAQKLKAEGNPNRFGLTANSGTKLEEACAETFVLGCGWEQAVAATKSVVEQALFYESILRHIDGSIDAFDLEALSAAVKTVLSNPIDPDIVKVAIGAPTIYFAGYNDGVAEELTLKTNEITRKKSDYLEGTYAVHGIEEVMEKEDIVFVIDPFDEEIDKFQEVLEKGVGLKVVAIAGRDTPFPTIIVPEAGALSNYVYLCAGWNLLVEIGLASGIDLDKPNRARKVGNELIGG
ncbi:MAG: sugar isomerase [Spirochaetota bacterium]|nr:sugar isomerase [Spirochaetota bacterium]